MFWKDDLARQILSRNPKYITYEWTLSLAESFPSIRVKTADAKGRVPMIQLSEKSGWMKPYEWATNHQLHLKQQHVELHSRLEAVKCDPPDRLPPEAAEEATVSDAQSDPSEYQRLLAENRKLAYNLALAWKAAVLLTQGKKLSGRYADILKSGSPDEALMIEPK